MTPVPAESVTVEQYLRAECHRYEARVAVSFLRANVPDLHHLTNLKSSLSRLFGPAAHILRILGLAQQEINQDMFMYLLQAKLAQLSNQLKEDWKAAKLDLLQEQVRSA